MGFGSARHLFLLAILAVFPGAKCLAQDGAAKPAPKPTVDLRPRWVAGETYRRTRTYSLSLRGNLGRGTARKRITFKVNQESDYIDQILAVSDGQPTHVRRTYKVFGQTVVRYVAGEDQSPPSKQAGLAGKTITLIQRGDELEVSDPAAALVQIKGEFDKAFAKHDIRVGERWKTKGDGARKHDLEAKVLKLMNYEGHPVAKVMIKLGSKSKLKGGGLDVAYRGYLYFATDVGKPLRIELKGPAKLKIPEGTLNGTAKIVDHLEPLAERVKPEPIPAAVGERTVPKESTAQEALLAARWTTGERSAIAVRLVQNVTLKMDTPAASMHSKQTTLLEYDETVLALEGGVPSNVRRDYTKHERHMSIKKGGSRINPAPEQMGLAGQRVTFARKDGRLAPTGPAPKRRQVMEALRGAAWEFALPGRVVKVGEKWRAKGWRENTMISPGLSETQMTLSAIQGDTVYITMKSLTLVNNKPGDLMSGDMVWVSCGTMEFSIRLGKVVRLEWLQPQRKDDTLGGRTSLVATRTMK